MLKAKTFIFFRGQNFYPIDMPESECKNYKSYKEMAKANAIRNEGTTKVEDTEGNVLWEA